MRNWRTWFEPMCQSDVNIIIHSFLSFVICMYPLEVYTIASCICIYIYIIVYIYIYTIIYIADQSSHVYPLTTEMSVQSWQVLRVLICLPSHSLRLLGCSEFVCSVRHWGVWRRKGACGACAKDALSTWSCSDLDQYIYIYTTSEYIWIQFYWKRTCPFW